MTGKPYALGGADPATAPLRVMLIPHAGAGASSALVFRQHLLQDWALAAIRPPGRESRIREAVPDPSPRRGILAAASASASASAARPRTRTRFSRSWTASASAGASAGN
ncbi:hypothetical protein AB0C95_31725 [Streptomyces caniferus]|uniref:hypothetical protein n=1 Tax=Streptomyces caniferus TaxID=285557 RepID=UPI0033DC40CC